MIRRLFYKFAHDLSSICKQKVTYIPTGKFKNLKIALIADTFTHECLLCECQIKEVLPANYKKILETWKPDLLLVESAFHAGKDKWKHKIAKHPEHGVDNQKLANVVKCARDLNIPAAFWNKDDDAHFDNFINSAMLFEYIFTTNDNCISRYRTLAGADAKVHTMMIPYQPAFHSFDGFNFKYNAANFTGTFYTKKYERRQYWQHMMFDACNKTRFDLTIFDRNSRRLTESMTFPSGYKMAVRHAVPHNMTARIYKDYLVSLNVNTIENSSTMYSRRLVEILACGGILVTSPSKAVNANFKDFCYVIDNSEEAVDLFSRLKTGPSKSDLERAEAGARYVASNHTWESRLQQICNIVGIN